MAIIFKKINVGSDFDIVVSTNFEDLNGAVESVTVWTGTSVPSYNGNIWVATKDSCRQILSVDDYSTYGDPDCGCVLTDLAHPGKMLVRIRNTKFSAGRVWLSYTLVDATGKRTTYTQPTDILLVRYGSGDGTGSCTQQGGSDWSSPSEEELEKIKREEYDRGVADGRAQGREEGYDDGFAEGEQKGFENGKKEGYEQGHTDGESSGREKGYAQGYEQGHTDGESSGREKGYAQGLAVGDAQGYDRGYAKGLVDGEDKWSKAGRDGLIDELERWGVIYPTLADWLREGRYDSQAFVDANHMFYGCSALSDVPKLHTENVIDMSWMFANCNTLSEVPDIDTSAVTNMASMFSGCSKLISVPQFETENVTNMEYMFYGCTLLAEVPPLEVASVDTAGMQSLPPNIKNITLKGFGSQAKYHSFTDSPPTLSTSWLYTNTSWGSDSESNRRSLVDTLLTYSADRVALGYETLEVKLHAKVLERLTDEEIAKIEAKGYELTI